MEHTPTFSEDEIGRANAIEQRALSEAQSAHLRQRVVTLQAHVLRLQAENEELRSQLAESAADKEPAE